MISVTLDVRVLRHRPSHGRQRDRGGVIHLALTAVLARDATLESVGKNLSKLWPAG